MSKRNQGQFGGIGDGDLSSYQRRWLKKGLVDLLDLWRAYITPNWMIPDKVFTSAEDKSRFITQATDMRNMLERILNRLDD